MKKADWYFEGRKQIHRRLLLVVVLGLGLGGLPLWGAATAVSNAQWGLAGILGLIGTAVLFLAVTQLRRVWQQPVLLITAVVLHQEIFTRGGAGGGLGYALLLQPSAIVQATSNGQQTSLPVPTEPIRYPTTPLIHSLVNEEQTVQLVCTTTPKRAIALWEQGEAVEESTEAS